jgi:hypothetical protein
MKRKPWPCPECGNPLRLIRSEPAGVRKLRERRSYSCGSHWIRTAEVVTALLPSGEQRRRRRKA